MEGTLVWRVEAVNKEGVGCSTCWSGVYPGLPLILYESGDNTLLSALHPFNAAPSGQWEGYALRWATGEPLDWGC